MLKGSYRKETAGTPLKVFSVFFLLLYLAGTVPIDAIHGWFHGDVLEALHSPEHESDPCHRNIYHHDRDNGCNHKSHIEKKEQCPLCGIVLHVPHLLTQPSEDFFRPVFAGPHPCGHPLPADGVTLYSSSRAPPRS